MAHEHRLIRGIVAAGIMLSVHCGFARADGVMRPSAASYPGDFLRHRVTRVDVAIHGQIAVTTVYQEFVNEWDQSIDAVYSFPLPPDARATDFLFWSNDTLFRAPLKVKEQAPNPGTGEGGIDALLNSYLGRNAIRVLLKEIPPGTTQRVQMEYISLCRYDGGKVIYEYPLETSQFLTYPLESLSFTFHVEGSDDITGVELPGWGDAVVTRTDSRHVMVALERSKIYLTGKLTLDVATAPESLSLDFFASNNDSLGGHFALLVKPGPDTTKILPKNVVFLLDASTSAAGDQLRGSVAATRSCLDRLRPGDIFNVMAYNSTLSEWRPSSVPASGVQVDSAKAFLDGISAGGWSNLAPALSAALAGFRPDSMNNMLFLFSDGRAPVDPLAVRSANSAGAAIFPIAYGENVRRTLLEMLAYQNYGLPTFIGQSDPIADEVGRLFNEVSRPVIRDTRMEIGPNAFDLLPRTLQTVYAGSRFFLTGRYHAAGTTPLSIAGLSPDGPKFYDFQLQFPAGRGSSTFAEKFWAKEKIDEIEREIDVYGPSDSLKQLDITLSLEYWIRCMYTAYIADKTIVVTGVDETATSVQSFTVSLAEGGAGLRWSLVHGEGIREVNIYRANSSGGPFMKIATLPASRTEFTDAGTSSREAWYKLELVTREGRRMMYGPVSASASPVPVSHLLLQNYPNPFNPSTSIRYEVAGGTGQVSLVIFDALGREVRSLVSSVQAPGAYEVVWDGKNDRGSPVSSGVYYSRLCIGAFSQTRVMSLMH